MIRRLICVATFTLILSCSAADAAVVGFLGSVDSGRAGMLGTLPRNFVLVLDYTPAVGVSGVSATGTLDFPDTPNSGTPNPDVHPEIFVPTSGGITIGDNTGVGGTDFLEFNGHVVAGLLGTNQVNYTFRFTKPSDTVDMLGVTPESIALLITGETSISFSGGADNLSAVGVVRGAPEPSTMIALSALVVGGCGVGYRRKKKASKTEDESEPN